ncbi:MAG: hypothetical protein WD555_01415, partial [Fulvivirga sp.]
MSGLLRVIIFLLSVVISTVAVYGQASVLREGEWYKLSVKADGVYKIDYNFLKLLGLNPDNIDPRKIKIYGNGSGMLPQRNSIDRPVDLIENRILINGENDGQFNAGDHILFYAQGADSYGYDEGGILHYEHNIYADLNYYFLTIGKDNGIRIDDAPDLGSDLPKINSFNAFQYYEKEAHNLIASGREWYSEKYQFTTSYSYSFPFPTLASDAEIKITSAVMAQSFAQSKFTLSVNGVALGEQAIERVEDFNKPAYRYSLKGRENISQFSLKTDQISESPLNVNVTYEKN